MCLSVCDEVDARLMLPIHLASAQREPMGMGLDGHGIKGPATRLMANGPA